MCNIIEMKHVNHNVKKTCETVRPNLVIVQPTLDCLGPSSSRPAKDSRASLAENLFATDSVFLILSSFEEKSVCLSRILSETKRYMILEEEERRRKVVTQRLDDGTHWLLKEFCFSPLSYDAFNSSAWASLFFRSLFRSEEVDKGDSTATSCSSFGRSCSRRKEERRKRVKEEQVFEKSATRIGRDFRWSRSRRSGGSLVLLTCFGARTH